jgi:hypothetical protein
MNAISKTALIKRIQRKLKRDGYYLRRHRVEQMVREYGQYGIYDSGSGFISELHVDLAQCARDLGVLAEGEAWMEPEDVAEARRLTLN